jgi:hypothetical protein
MDLRILHLRKISRILPGWNAVRRYQEVDKRPNPRSCQSNPDQATRGGLENQADRL